MDLHDPSTSGDAAIERLLQHAGWLRQLAASLVVDAAQADDVAQQTLLLALQRPPASGRHPRAWLATAARHVARTFARSERRRESREKLAAADVRLPATDELVSQATLHHAVVGALLAVDEPYRSLLLRRWFEEKKPGAIAAEMGVPVETVRTRLKRGLELVRAELVRRRALPGGVVALVALLDGPAWAMAREGVAAAGVGVGAAAAGGGVVVMATKTKLVAAVFVVAALVAAARFVVGSRADERRGEAAVASGREAADAGALAAADAERSGVAAQRDLQPAARTARTVHGRVVDEVGEPVAGARVGWLAPAAPLDSRADRLFAPPFDWNSGTITTSTDGSFELPWDDALAGGRSTLDFTVTAAGFEPRLWPRARAGERIVVTLWRGIDCFGTVRDMTGAPVVDATVRWRVHGDRLVSESAVTDGEGRYRFERAWPSHGSSLAGDGVTPWIDVVADGFAPATFVAYDNEREIGERRWQVDVWLVRGATIRGQVVDRETGAPIEGADVWLRMFDPRAGRAPVRTRSGSDGRFVLEHVPAWGVTLVGMRSPMLGRRHLGTVCAMADERGMAQEQLDVPDDGAELTLRFELPRLGGVRGRVVDPQGTPVAGAFVFVAGKAGGWRNDRSELDGTEHSTGTMARTDDGGRYQIDGLALADGAATKAPISSRVEAGEIVSARCDTISVPLVADQVVEAPDLVVVPRPVTRVEIVDEAGIAVAGATVRSLTPKGSGFIIDGSGSTDAAGCCWLEVQAVRGAVAAVTGDGYAPAEAEIAPDARELRIVLQPEHRLRGRVVDVDGQAGRAIVAAVRATEPVEVFRASIESRKLWRDANYGRAACMETRSGWFDFRGLGPGPWHVVAVVRLDTGSGRGEFVVQPEVTEADGEIKIVLEGSAGGSDEATGTSDPAALGTVECTLTYASTGRPVLRTGGAQLFAGTTQNIAPRSIAPGRFEFVRVPAGRFELLVDVPGFARQRRAIEVLAGETTSIAIAIDEGVVARGRVTLPDVASVEKATYFFASDDGGGGVFGEVQSDGAYEISGLVAGRSYRRWLSVKELDEQRSLWIAAGPALPAADVARDEAPKWLRAANLLVQFSRPDLLGDAASLTLRDEAGRVVWTQARLNPNSNFGRLLPIGTYQVDLMIPGRATETQTVDLQPSDRGTELRFMLKE